MRTLNIFILSAISMICVAFNANALKNANGNDFYGTTHQAYYGDNADTEEDNQPRKGYWVEYQNIENGWGLSLGAKLKYFLINAGCHIGEDSDFIERNNRWYIGVGGNARFWLNNFLFLEGNVGVAFYHTDLEFNSYSHRAEYTEDEFGFFLAPRVGLNIKGLDLLIGYRWDFVDFKFGRNNRHDYFTIALGF